MRIQCPDCEARYEVPDDRLQPGRTVRCARCGHQWAPVAPVAEAAPNVAAVPDPAPPSVPAPDAVEPRPRAPHPFLAGPRGVPDTEPLLSWPAADVPPRRRGLVAAWVLSILVLAGAGWAAMAFRGPIAAAWPPSLRVYNALGVAPAAR